LIDEKALADACNQTLCQVNGSVVRLGVVQGEYHWHKHEDDDEFFYVVEGKLLIDLEDRTIELGPRQGLVIPKGVVHRTRAAERTMMLMVENAGIVPTVGTDRSTRKNPSGAEAVQPRLRVPARVDLVTGATPSNGRWHHTAGSLPKLMSVLR
jgi:hypothetical protein